MKKRLIALMCTGVVMLGTASMTGCEEYVPPEYQISLEYNGKSVLHKGTVTPGIVYVSYQNSANAGYTTLDFNCGESITSNLHHIISETQMDEKYYDEVCTHCFTEEEIEAMEQ